MERELVLLMQSIEQVAPGADNAQNDSTTENSARRTDRSDPCHSTTEHAWRSISRHCASSSRKFTPWIRQAMVKVSRGFFMVVDA